MSWMWWLIAPLVPTAVVAAAVWVRGQGEVRRGMWERRNAIADHRRLLDALDRGRLANLDAGSGSRATEACSPRWPPSNLWLLDTPAPEGAGSDH